MIKTEINKINDQNTNPSFNESFVAFRIENTVASNNISASNNDVPQVDNSKNDIKNDSNKVGWVDVVEIEH